MKARTELLLYHLMWAAESLLRPTSKTATASFEKWAYGNGFLRQVQRLEAEGYLEQQRGPATRRIFRLSEKGRLQTLGGRDPEALWSAPWDRCWRMVVFDLPSTESGARRRLLRQLRAEGFGLLQHSVWISPHAPSETVQKLAGRGDDACAFFNLTTQPVPPATGMHLVKQAWDFEEVTRLHRRHLKILNSFPSSVADKSTGRAALRAWSERERENWRAIASADPFLPRSLWPRGYAGEKVLNARRRAFFQAGQMAADLCLA